MGKNDNQQATDVLGLGRGNVTTNENAAMQPQEQQALQDQQNALQDSRTQILQVLQQQNLLTPQLLSSLGFTMGPNGQITDQGAAGGTMAEMFGRGPEQLKINEMLRQRQLDALAGNATDPGLERNLGLQEQTLRNQLRAQLGSTYETSTPGMQALSEFRQRAAESRYSVGRDVLTNAAGINNTNYLTGGNLATQRLGSVMNAEGMTAPTLSALNTNTGQYGAVTGELGNIFNRGSTSQLTQEQTAAQHEKNFLGMFNFGF